MPPEAYFSMPIGLAAALAVAVLFAALAYRSERADHAKTVMRLLDLERAAALDRLQNADKLDALVRETIAPTPKDFGARVRAIQAKLEGIVPSVAPAKAPIRQAEHCGACVRRMAANDGEIAALRRDVDRLLAERPQGYRRAG